ncbi:MAG: DDE-type integrase/transposase/recombinase [Dehalococcoidales bacterium]|nr:DDE-type integrase/transposase/recombinase [Dehalococcoidales bacterium]
MAIEITTTEQVKCKNCDSNAVVKFGKYKGVQRYYCKSCKRKFKFDADAFHGKIPSSYVSSSVNMYYTGSSINEIRSHLKAEHGYYPSKSVVFGWVNKYTDLATKQFKDYHPQVGNTWVADETMLDVDGQHKLWFYDIIDTETRFLLASRVTLTRTTNDAQRLMEEAKERAGKTPKQVITDQNYSYLDGIEKAYGADAEHVLGNPFKAKDSGESTSQIERFHGTLKDRTKVIRAFRDFETLKQFTDGWLVYYNFFKPHQSLNGKTPAEEANVDYAVKSWADLSRLPVAKETEVKSHNAKETITPKAKISLATAYKRRRTKISPATPRISERMGKLR